MTVNLTSEVGLASIRLSGSWVLEDTFLIRNVSWYQPMWLETDLGTVEGRLTHPHPICGGGLSQGQACRTLQLGDLFAVCFSLALRDSFPGPLMLVHEEHRCDPISNFALFLKKLRERSLLPEQ